MPDTVASKKNNAKYYIFAFVSLFLMFFFGQVVKPFAGIKPAGVSILGIFFGVLIATIYTGETFWPAVLGLFAMVTTNYMAGPALLSNWFGNTTIQQIIWVMALTGAVTESGAVNVLGRKMLRIKALQGHPMRLIITLFLTVLACSALVSSPTTMLLLWYPILDGICDMCSIKDDSDLKRELLLGIYIATMGAYILPFKGVHLSSIAIISGIMKSSGLVFNDAAYLITATLVVVALVVVYALFIPLVWKTDLTPLKEYDVKKMGLKDSDFKLTGKQRTLLGFMIFGIVFLLISMFLPAKSELTTLYNRVGTIWIWILLFGILSMMRDKDGKPFIDGVKLLQSRTMWGIIAVAGCFTICGAAIASDDLGIKAAISAALGPVLKNANWPMLVFLCVAVSTIFTNFTNGMPVSFTINAICIPIAVTLQKSGGGNATILGVATILSGMCAFLTNGAIAYAPIMLGRKEMTQKFIWTKGVVTNIIFIVLASLICIVLGYVFK